MRRSSEKTKRRSFKPVEFDEGAKGARQIAAFKRKCHDPKFVAECLVEYQSWRRGTGRYEFVGDPVKNAPPPFCPEALGIVEDAAIKFLMYYHGTVRDGNVISPSGEARAT